MSDRRKPAKKEPMRPTDFTMPLPSDKMIEAQVIAHVLAKPDRLYAAGVARLITPDFFHFVDFWGALQDLRASGVTPTLISVQAELRSRGSSAIPDEDDVVLLQTFDQHADLVHLSSQLKKLRDSRMAVRHGNLLAAAGYNEDVAEAMSVAQAMLDRQDEMEDAPITSQTDVVQSIYDAVFGERTQGIPTFMKSLNDTLALGGLPRRLTTGLMGKSSMGKTMWAIRQLVFTASWLLATGQKGCVIYLAQDGDPDKLLGDYAAACLGMRQNEIRDHFSSALKRQFVDHLTFLKRLPIVWNGEGNFTDTTLRRVVAYAERTHGTPHLIVADYLQKYQLEQRTASPKERIDGFLNAWGEVMKAGQAAGLLLVQPNRGMEKRDDKRPKLSDCSDSAEIENSMETFLGLYREEYYTPQDRNYRGLGEVIVMKNKGGERNVTLKARFITGVWAPMEGDMTALPDYADFSEDDLSWVHANSNDGRPVTVMEPLRQPPTTMEDDILD